MSIEDQIDDLLNTQLFLLGDQETPRTMYITVEVRAMVGEALGDTPEAERHAKATGVLEAFANGDWITISEEPFNKERHTILSRVDPVEDEFWEFRCLDPDPGIRVLGAFSDKDTFVAVTWDYRENFDDDWPQQVQRCKDEWMRLFGDISLYKGKRLNDYVSYNFESS
jgi:hypothetical protein